MQAVETEDREESRAVEIEDKNVDSLSLSDANIGVYSIISTTLTKKNNKTATGQYAQKNGFV